MTLALRFAARSDVGLLREGNEDSVYAGPRVLAVADGMGGHAAGEVASAVAISALAPLDEDAPGPDLLEALRDAALAANAHLRDMVAGDSALDGMGTTLTTLLFAGTRLGLLHIGDSRCYLLRDGELTQITHDHTLVQSLVDEGRISEDEASTHPQRSLITRALDGRDEIELDLSVREARTGDRYLLCTDGLTGPVGRLQTLQEALSLPSPQEACDRLVELALRGGGPDNITVIVADVVDASGLGHAAPVVAGAAAEAPQAPPAGAAQSAAARARTAEGRDTQRTREVSADAGLPPPPKRHEKRMLLIGLLAVVLLGVLTAAGWAYVRTQYYVGTDGEHVAIFRGVNGSVGGLDLASVEQRTDLTLDRLDEVHRAAVEKGYVAEDRADARDFVERLEASAIPLCPPGATAQPTGVAPTSGPTALPTAPAPDADVPPSDPARPAEPCVPRPESP